MAMRFEFFRRVRLTLGLVAIATTVSAQSADQRFAQIWQQEWQWRMAQSPILATANGEYRYNNELGDVSSASQLVRLKYLRSIDGKLKSIDAKSLSAEQQINFAIYRSQIQDGIQDIELQSYLLLINSDSSAFDSLIQLPQLHPFETRKDYADYLSRLKKIPNYIDQCIALLKTGLKRGITAPRISLVGREKALEGLMDVASMDAYALYKPFISKQAQRFAQTPATDTQDSLALIQKQAADVISKEVAPAFKRLHTFLTNTYIPGARTSIAASAMPNGAAFYRQQVRSFTTTDASPDQIHDIGLKEVARIEKAMQTVMTELKFTGSLPEFVASLRSDPQFYVDSEEELLMHAAWIAKRIDSELPSYFGILPRQPFGIQKVPEAIAPFYTAGRYNGGPEGAHAPGFYMLNTHNLASRPLYSLPALTMHEAVPGHHLQIALANEQQAQPPFRRFNYISAYGEGWALYAEELGVEMGIYRTPYERFGQLSYAMWRAARLVVDTGIHHKGWSREQARRYMRERTALSEHEIETEVDRYISWPGQALSYMLGCIQIKQLRAEAQQALGTKFDIRAFHDHLLSLGSVPLHVLNEQMRRWIALQSNT
jgi:uncharacterized protein (DUF885 family)